MMTGESRQIQEAAVGELDVPYATAAAGGRLQVLVDQPEDNAGGRQT